MSVKNLDCDWCEFGSDFRKVVCILASILSPLETIHDSD